MRISTGQIFQQGVNALLEQQAALSKTQLQLSSGQRILTPSDDPAGAAQELNLRQFIDTTQQYQANSDAAKARLSLEESTLSSATDLLQRVRELAVQANNATQTDETRRGIAQEVRRRLEELSALANTKDANNEYIFAGFKAQTLPFTSNGSGGVDYNGDQGGRYLQIAPSVQVAVGDTGADVFQLIRNGNGSFTTLDNPGNTGTGIIDPGSVNGTFVPDVYTVAFSQPLPTSPVTYTVTGAASGLVASGTYTSGGTIGFNGVQTSVSGLPANGDSFTISPSANQDMFATLQNFINALEAGAATPKAQANFNNAANRALIDLDQALGNILKVRASVGARLNVIDSQRDANDAFLLQLQQTLSNVQDLDYAEAVSRLNRQLLALQAAQQTFVKVQNLSLFNFIR